MFQAPRNGFQLTGAQLLAKEKFPNFFTNFTKISLIKRLNIKNWRVPGTLCPKLTGAQAPVAPVLTRALKYVSYLVTPAILRSYSELKQNKIKYNVLDYFYPIPLHIISMTITISSPIWWLSFWPRVIATVLETWKLGWGWRWGREWIWSKLLLWIKKNCQSWLASLAMTNLLP